MSTNSFTGPHSTTFEIQDAAPETAVLGVGAFEQHSHHLPLDTDYLIADRISRDVAREVGAFLLHTLAYSVSLSHLGFSGTVLLRPETLTRVIRDIADSVDRSGIRYLAVLNYHGGNFILNPAIREWNMDGRTPFIMHVEVTNGMTGRGKNLHACDMETSVMLHLYPEMVRMDLACDFVPEEERADLTHFGMKGLSPEGVWGYPSQATPEKGQAWLKEAVDYSVRRIRELQGQR